MILKESREYEIAEQVIALMEEFRVLRNNSAAVHWIEDRVGNLIVFTRGEYKQQIRDAIADNLQPEEKFEQETLEYDENEE